MAREDDEGGGFLSRWSRRKAEVRQGRAVQEVPVTPAAAPVVSPVLPEAPPPAPLPVPSAATAVEPPSEVPAEPPPTLDDVARLTTDSDFRRFVTPAVDPSVKNAALKKLFADPHFNVMDGLDIYIDDYGKPDPLPPSLLRQMASAHALGLFRDEEAQKPPKIAPDDAPTDDVPPATETPSADENAAVRLQPDDAAGPDVAGPDAPGAGEDAGRLG